ncbi:MAG: zinc-binding dehydrogenase [Acidobacteria bacterium]|nr:zinc-binding dehydrogenase [Acidobacteriota bacterium]NIM62845.1 zinc-binding dehydrogenase [Acidobacteriota bacterium]NIO60475.1 zinc-binding dehydrogenase [Acidobacteriota bacterium]NIQ31581.1 zinc-binding dehydrogenase [Acidobacteriota bacterium]NIQ86831.1 zinc-binding dehydrogenase [Acidobacteriota bacterium]
MKVIEISESFGTDRLRLADRPEPEPGDGQLLLKMNAASLNYRDWLMVTGRYNPKQPLPLIPCSDGSGEVLECGGGVTGFAPRDRVLPIFAPRWIEGKPDREKLRTTLGGPLDGVLTRRMVVDADSVVRTPAHLDDVEAACLPCAAVTAWNALVVHGELAEGDRVLVQGSGGVSIFALQLARAMGAEVWAISSRDECLARMRELGAVDGVNYKTVPEWGREIRKRSGGVDLVVDVGGGATLPQSLAAVGLGGRICQVGNLGGGSVELNLIPLFMQQVRLQGLLVGDRCSFEALNDLIENKKLRPIVDRTFAWTEAGAALDYLAAGQQFGKVCLSIEE